MKRVNTILVIILFAIVAGCVADSVISKKKSTDFIVVDVTKTNYPQKELILQDFMDVEYIPLETGREFLCQRRVLAIGKDMIIIANDRDDGDIFIFDRNGKGLRKINRRGQGPEEYLTISAFVLDEDNNEIIIRDITSRKILVYDLNGKFKRNIGNEENNMIFAMRNFDREHLICHNNDRRRIGENSHFIISKQTGNIVRNIKLHFKNAINPSILGIQRSASVRPLPPLPMAYPMLYNYQGNFIILEPSSDTVFMYSPDHKMKPVTVRTPSIHSMDPKIHLFPSTITEQYYFMGCFNETQKNVITTNFMYDKQAGTMFKYVVYNDDYSNKEISMNPIFVTGNNNETAFSVAIDAFDLVEAYKENKLKGKLKEIA